jgi:hypothetical protein
MKVARSQATKIVVTDVPRLDPVTVFAEDLGPRQGKITIECYGKSWSAYWGGMGDRTIIEFFRSCSVDYIANKMTDERADITDADAIADGARRQIIRLRRGHVMTSFDRTRTFRIGRDEITAAKARELWECVDIAHFGDDGWGESNLMQEIFGDEWWYSLPTKPNPAYQYLSRVIGAVQDAFALDKSAAAADSGASAG